MSGSLEGLRAGDLIDVIDSAGTSRPKRAFGPVTREGNFPVVWACREEEWQAALAEGRAAVGIPWPAEDVSVAENAPVATSSAAAPGATTSATPEATDA